MLRRWSTVSEPADAPSGIGRASALLASGTLVSRILGFVKVAVLANIIGLLAAGDAFALGNQLPNAVYELVAGGVLTAVLIPQIVRAGLHADGGQRFINKLLTLGIVVFLVVTVIATLAAPWLVALYTQSATADGKGFSGDGLALATAFAYWCLPQILFYSVYSLLGEVLNARKVFGPFAWAPVLNNVVAIAGLVIFSILFGGASKNSSPEVWTASMIAVLAGSATLGIVAQAGVLVYFWRRTGLSYRPDFRWHGVGLGKVGRSAGWLFAMVAASQLAGIVQSNVVSLSAGTGTSIFALQNAWLIFMVPFSVIVVSTMTVYFTRMSGHAAAGNLAGVRADLSSSMRAIGMILVFSTAALIVAAYPLSRIFTDQFDNLVGMGNVIIAYAIGLVPFSMFFVLQRVFYSLEDTRTVFYIVLARAVLFVIASLLVALLPVERIGIAMAFATSAVAFAQFVIIFFVLRRRLGSLDGRLVLRRHTQYLAAGLVAGAAGFVVLALLGGLRSGGFAVAHAGSAIVSIGAIGAVMAAVYVALLMAMHNPELRVVVGTVMTRFRRNGSE